MEKTLKQMIDNKFRLKYAALFAMTTSIFTILIIIVIQYFRTIDWKIEIGAIIFVLCALYLNYKYWKFELKKECNDKDYILLFLEYFINQKFRNGDFKYIETLKWFYKDVKKLYHNCNNHDELFEVLNKLYKALKSDSRGLCKASFKKEEFVNLCEQLKLAIVENKSNYEISMDSTMNTLVEEINNTPEYVMPTREFIKRAVFETACTYYVIVALHLLGCHIVSDSFGNLIGNILLAIPGDILLILIYHNVVKEKSN